MRSLHQPSFYEQIANEIPEPARSVVVAGLSEFQLPLARLSLEVIDAESRSIPFRDAARLATEFPVLSRTHFGLQDLLQYELSVEELRAVRALLDQFAPLDFESARRGLFLAAAAGPGPEAAAARFFMYQAIRLNVVLGTWQGGEDIEAMGALAEMEMHAETRLREALDDAAMLHEDVRPLHVLVAEAFVDLHALWADWVGRSQPWSQEAAARFDIRRSAARRARASGAHEAAILRAAVESADEGARAGSQQIADRHPTLFGGANAVDQRRSRMKACIHSGTDPAPRTRLVDVLMEDLT